MRRGHGAFEVGGPVDLAGDQHRAVEQEGWLTALDHVEADGYGTAAGTTASNARRESTSRVVDVSVVDGRRI
jgi:hypothetical protein